VSNRKTYFSIGSNLGDREQNLKTAVEMLAANPRVTILRQSSVYETEPQDVAAQPWFLNIAVEAWTSLFPMQLLTFTQSVERGMGRVRRLAKGPRIIDIDILLYGAVVVRTPTLEIPHPAMTERRFVLEPLAEIVPGLRHPVTKKTVAEHLKAIQGQTVRRHVKNT